MKTINIERLVDERKKHGFSQKYIALTIGVAPSNVSSWESGIKSPSKENLVKLAELLGVSTDYLLGISDTSKSTVDVDSLTLDEKKLILDYRKLNAQGQEYIRQTMFMAVPIYIKHSDVPNLENTQVG